MDIFLHAPEGNLALVTTLLAIFSCVLYLLYSSSEGWDPAFHMLFLVTLVLCSIWSLFSIHVTIIGDAPLPSLKHFVNTFLIALASSLYFIVSFLMFLVDEKTRLAE